MKTLQILIASRVMSKKTWQFEWLLLSNVLLFLMVLHGNLNFTKAKDVQGLKTQTIKLEHYFLNIEWICTCSSIGDRTRTSYFWLRTNEHRTLNLIGLSLNLLNYSSNWLEHHFFEHRTNSNVFIYWKSNSNTLFLPSNDRTSNFEHSSTHHYY